MRPDEIARAIRQAIRERALPPGQAINQDELARTYGVSRIPLREALRTLAGEGLIIIRPGLGAIVTELNASEVDELYGLRLQLEPPLAQPIMDNVRRSDIESLAAMAQSMSELGKAHSEEWSTLNYRFHRRLYELSNRRHSTRLVVQVLNLVEPYARVHAHLLGSRDRMQEERAATVACLRASDTSALQGQIRESIESARTELVASMGRPQAV